MQPIPVHPQTPRNWWGRNWKWLVPVGCLGITGLVAVIVAFVVFVTAAVFGMIKSSDAYKVPVQRAQASVEVQAALGQPIEPAWYLTGNLKVNGNTGNANLAIPLHGPRGKATLYVVGTSAAGKWTFSTLKVKLQTDGTEIDLLGGTTL